MGKADSESYYRHRFLTVVRLEEDGIKPVKSERVIHSSFGGGLSKRMEHPCFDLPVDRCPHAIQIFQSRLGQQTNHI